jgi:Phage integrase family
VVNGSFRGPKERRSFKPKVAGSTPVGRIPWCSGPCRALRGGSQALRPSGSDCALRLGRSCSCAGRDSGETLQVRRTAHGGQILEGAKPDHDEPDAGRVVPVPATLAWMLEAQINLNGPKCELLFTTRRGHLWRERTFYRDLWKPAQDASALDIRPHECRHSFVIHSRADPSIDDADLANIVGHRVETMLARYTHALDRALRRSVARWSSKPLPSGLPSIPQPSTKPRGSVCLRFGDHAVSFPFPRGCRFLAAAKVSLLLGSLPFSIHLDSLARPVFGPSNSAVSDEVMRATGKAPVSDRWKERDLLAVVRHLPVKGSKRRYYLLTTATSA